MANDLNVANTILAQMGGSRLIAMVGAHRFLGTANSLTFQFKARAKDGIKAVRITLDPSDTYTMVFMKPASKKDHIAGRSLGFVEAGKFSDVYADQLQSIFTSATGLDTHL